MAFSRRTEPVFGNARFRTALEVRKKPRENNLATVNLKCHGEPVEPWPLAAHVTQHLDILRSLIVEWKMEAGRRWH